MKNFRRLRYVLLADKLLRNGQRRLGGLLPHPSAVREETVIFFLARVALSPSQPRGDRLAHRRDTEKHFSFQLKKQFLFQVLFLFLNVKLFGFKWKKKKRERKKIQKVFFFFKQKKHTYKLPYQLASQGCQTHLAPKETQKKKSKLKKSKSKIYFYHCQSIFFMVSPPWVGLDVSL